MNETAFAIDAGVARALLDDLGAGSALPTRWYSDPQIFAAELERIHRRSWHFATHTGELPAASCRCRRTSGVR
jgi:hypothetical protein